MVWDLNSPPKEKPLLKLCCYREILVSSITKRKARVSLKPRKNACKKERGGVENKKTNPKPTDKNKKFLSHSVPGTRKRERKNSHHPKDQDCQSRKRAYAQNVNLTTRNTRTQH